MIGDKLWKCHFCFVTLSGQIRSDYAYIEGRCYILSILS